MFATFFIILFFVVFTQIKLSYNNKTFHGIIINKHIVNYKGLLYILSPLECMDLEKEKIKKKLLNF